MTSPPADPLFLRLNDAIDFLIETGNGSARDDLPKWAEGEGVQLLIDARERIQAVPTVVPMRPDEKPTEPGWYVVDSDGDRSVSEVSMSGGELWFEPRRLRVLASDRFIARIYPERIGEE